jgi:hypothetical protein
VIVDVDMLTGDARREAAAKATKWGYPRPISEREINTGSWFTNGRAIIWYVEPIDPLSPVELLPWVVERFEGVLCVHGIADPEQVASKNGAALTVHTEQLICKIGGWLGARKLYSLIPHETPRMPVRAMRRYLRRFGWSEDEFGSFKILGG